MSEKQQVAPASEQPFTPVVLDPAAAVTPAAEVVSNVEAVEVVPALDSDTIVVRPLFEFRTGQMVQFQILPMVVLSFNADTAARLKDLVLPPTEFGWKQPMAKADSEKGLRTGGIRALLPELLAVLKDLNSRNYTVIASGNKQVSGKGVLEETLEKMVEYFTAKVPTGSVSAEDRDLLPSFHFWTDKAETEDPSMVTTINGVFAVVIPVRSIIDYTKAMASIMRRSQAAGPVFLGYFIDANTEVLDASCAITEQRVAMVRKGFSGYTRSLLVENPDGYWWIPRYRTTIERVMAPTEGTFLVSLVNGETAKE